MRKLLVTSLLLAAAAALAVAATATGAGSAPRPGASRAARPTRSTSSRTAPSRSARTTRRSRRGSAAPRRRSRGRSRIRTAARATSRPSRTPIASQLGFTKAQVKWTVVPFNNSFRPGKKPFDFYVTQVSFSPERARAVDFSKSYYFVNQAVVAPQGHADREGQVDRRPQAVQARRPGRDDELHVHHAVHQAVVRPARLRHERRRRPGAEERPDRRHRRRPPDRVLRHRRPGRRRRDRRQAPDEGHEGALRARLPEGQHPPRLRQPRARPPLAQRDDQEAPADVSREGRRAGPEVADAERRAGAPGSSAA